MSSEEESEDSEDKHHEFKFVENTFSCTIPTRYSLDETMDKEQVEKINSKFVRTKLWDKLQQNEPLRHLDIECDFITKSGAKELANYFSDHNICSFTVKGEYDRRCGIESENLSKKKTSGVVQMVRAFDNVNIEKMAVENIIYSDLDDDLIAISKILAKRKKSLQNLEMLEGCGERDEFSCAGKIAICRFLCKNPNLKGIALGGTFNHVATALFCRMLATNTNLQALDLQSCEFLGDIAAVISGLAANRYLTKLDVSIKLNTGRVFKQIGAAMEKNTCLKKLLWSVGSAKWNMEKYLGVLPRLIERNSTLETISFTQGQILPSRFVRSIQKNQTLKVLDLTSCTFPEGSSAERLLEAIFASNLAKFIYNETPGAARDQILISEAICAAMKSNRCLRKLKVSLALPLSLVKVFFTSIPPQLKQILMIVIPTDLTETTCAQLHSSLSKTTLSEVSFKFVDLSTGMIELFLKGLPTTHLECLRLQFNVLDTFPDPLAIEQALQSNSCIKELNFDCVKSKQPENDPELFASHILTLVNHLPPSLEGLEVRWSHIHHNKIPKTTYLKFVEAISENYSLTECVIADSYPFKKIVNRNRKLKEEARFKRGKVALGKNHEIQRDENSPRKLVKHA